MCPKTSIAAFSAVMAAVGLVAVSCGGSGDEDGSEPGPTSAAGAAGASAQVAPIEIGGSTGQVYDCPGDPVEMVIEPDATSESAFVFDDAALRSYHLTLPPETWEALQINARDEEFVTASLRVEDEEVGDIGIRFKGGWTLHSCFDDNDELMCDKMSLKLKFSHVDPELRWRGLERLNFHALKADPTKMHERLAYQTYREMGMLAPRATHAKVYVNGEYYGLFALVENVRETFVQGRFPGNGDGNLYKEAWPLPIDTTAAPGRDESWLSRRLRSNLEVPNHERLLAFGTELAETTDEAELPAVLARWIDVDYFLRFMAVEDAIDHWDAVNAWYCEHHSDDGQELGDLGCLNHNYYWYQQPDGCRFWIIAWDMDATFESNYFRARRVPQWNEPDPMECRTDVYSFSDLAVRAASCDPLLRAASLADQSAYVQALHDLLDGPMNPERLSEDLARWVAQVDPAVIEEEGGTDTVSYQIWLEDLQTLEESFQDRADDRIGGLLAAAEEAD